MTFSTVVAGLDLGPNCQPVADFARALSARLGAQLVYVHAEDEEPLGPGWAELAMEAERYRREAAEHYAIEGGAEVVWREGPAAAALQNEAEARRAGFVVAGTGAFGNQPFLGGVATRMLRTVTVPLLFVPTHEGARVGLAREPKVLGPVDFSPDNDPALGFVREFGLRLRAAIELVTVVRPPRLVAHLSPETALQLPGLLKEMIDEAKARLAEHARAHQLGDAMLRVLESDEAADAILSEAQAKDVDLIALPSHGKGPLARLFVGSTTEKLARITDRPLLVFPPTWLATNRPEPT